MTNKGVSESGLSSRGSYGFRGEGPLPAFTSTGWILIHSFAALASIAALGLLEITSRTQSSRHTYAKLIKVSLPMPVKSLIISSQSSKTIYEGNTSRAISGTHGTAVIVKDLFHNVSIFLAYCRTKLIRLGARTPSILSCQVSRVNPCGLQKGRRDSRIGKTWSTIHIVGGEEYRVIDWSRSQEDSIDTGGWSTGSTQPEC